MPRQGRINVEGGIYHVIQRGIERKEIFKDDLDRKEFLNRVSGGLKETGHKCYGWALMPNHFHLIIRTGKRPLSDLMRKILTGYALYFNKKYKRSGYLYQGRYKSILCQEDSYLLELVRYVHLNALRARLVRDMSGLGDYKWSGHSVLMNKNKAEWQSRDEILEYFGKNKLDAMRRYEEFVAEAKGNSKREDLTGGGLIRSAGGWKEVLNLRRSKEKWIADERILGDGEFVSTTLKQADEEMERKERLKKEGWEINRLVKTVCKLLGIDEKDIKRESRRSKLSQARSLIAYWGNKELGISGVELAGYFGITKSSISEAIVRGRKIAHENEYRIT
ncbi:MAG: transposase [Elusimicrobia bacterium]|nr:transposase [Candidatus Liberimonas magnetica]